MAYRFANDGYCTIVYVSEGACRLTGWRPDQLVGSPHGTNFRFAYHEDVEAGFAVVRKVLSAIEKELPPDIVR